MAFPWLAQLLIALVVQVAGYILMPKPKTSRPDAFKEMENPVAEAGKPVPVIWGETELRELNVLWYGDKSTVTYNID